MIGDPPPTMMCDFHFPREPVQQVYSPFWLTPPDNTELTSQVKDSQEALALLKDEISRLKSIIIYLNRRIGGLENHDH